MPVGTPGVSVQYAKMVLEVVLYNENRYTLSFAVRTNCRAITSEYPLPRLNQLAGTLIGIGVDVGVDVFVGVGVFVHVGVGVAVGANVGVGV